MTEVKGTPVHQVFVGSCTNGSYMDLKAVAEIMKGRKVHPQVDFFIHASSKKDLELIAREGHLTDLLEAGVNVAEPTCGRASAAGTFRPPEPTRFGWPIGTSRGAAVSRRTKSTCRARRWGRHPRSPGRSRIRGNWAWWLRDRTSPSNSPRRTPTSSLRLRKVRPKGLRYSAGQHSARARQGAHRGSDRR